MRGRERSALVILVILMLFCFSSADITSAEKAVIVSDVNGLYNYVPADNHVAHGSTLKVYTEMSGVNYKGFVFVDFVFIIEDPRGHVVSLDRVDVRHRSYDDTVYVEYTKEIPSWWLHGKYDLDIYAYNRLNKARINELERKVKVTNTLEELLDSDNEDDFEDMEDFFEDACDGDEDDLEDLGVIRSFADSRWSREVTHISFFVCREEEIKPQEVEERKEPVFSVTDVEIDKFKVKPNETVSIAVTVKNMGIRGTKKVTLVINGEKEGEESVTLDYFASKTILFTVTKDLPGTYKVTIPGTDIVKLFFVEESHGGEEGTGNSTSFLYSEPEVPKGDSGLPIQVFGIIGILVIIITITLRHFCLRSKQFCRYSRFYH